jgi:DNA-directed RNA polymerase specialized sigma24 family protein
MADLETTKVHLRAPRGFGTMLEGLCEADIVSITKIIISLASKFTTRFPFLVFDDCIQEAWRELIKYQDYYTPGKSKVTTWVYKLVNDTLTSFAQKEFSKTQKWDSIEDHMHEGATLTDPLTSCSYSDLTRCLEEALSPHCCKLLHVLENNPAACQAELARVLGLSERDIVYLREELRLTTQHVLEL